MKTLLLAALLFTSTAFARGVPVPGCKEIEGRTVLVYQNRPHMFMDFCQNDRGIQSGKKCQEYFQNSAPGLLKHEIGEFLKSRLAKICGK